MATLAEPATYSPDAPQDWINGGFEPLYARSWRDFEGVQTQALIARFEQFKGSVAALDKLARREGVIVDRQRRGCAAAAVRPPRLQELSARADREPRYRQAQQLARPPDHARPDARWTSPASRRSTTGSTRLDEFGMLVGHFVGHDRQAQLRAALASRVAALDALLQRGAARDDRGRTPRPITVETFFPGYRGGHQMMIKMLSLFNIPAAGGPEHYHTLYQTHISVRPAVAGRAHAGGRGPRRARQARARSRAAQGARGHDRAGPAPRAGHRGLVLQAVRGIPRQAGQDRRHLRRPHPHRAQRHRQGHQARIRARLASSSPAAA